ncbi:MAG: glycosyltransferase [Clostridiales bacterium]|jgi:glycosyltransferase involved in cell wall biosynthesis|nr:glycosyltransferase [Clostridiales bacterium]
MLSVIVPSFNEEQLITQTAARLKSILLDADIHYEIIFVDDGSSDGTWDRICLASEDNEAVRGISFSRNFGKDAAIFAGLEAAKGDCCAVIDCDLQHPPEKLLEMFALWQDGFEVVNGAKSSRGKEKKSHSFAIKWFYNMMSKAVKIDMTRASDYKLLDRRVVQTLLSLPERKPFFRALAVWVGFRTAEVDFDVDERKAGSSHWSTFSLFRYALSNISSFSAAPMQIVTLLGFVMLAVLFILGIHTLVRWFSGNAVEGFTTVILLQLLIGSILMISIGIIGYYIAQIFTEIKGRPRYIVTKHCGGRDE